MVPLAWTGDRYRDFTPYVASMNDNGVVAFQAALSDGASGVFIGRGGAIEAILGVDGPCAAAVSHPDIDRNSSLCFYGSLPSGDPAVFFVRADRVAAIARTRGPLGPTMNDEGVVAFRVDQDSGVSAICTARVGGPINIIADTSDRFEAFHGLPVINSRGSVAFRADLRAGGQMIGASDGAGCTTLVTTGDGFAALGNFPDMNDAGAVAFAATLPSGKTGIFLATGSAVLPVIDSRGPFESLRSALVNNEGTIVFAATPRGGRLGVFCGPDPVTDRIIEIGVPLFGSAVADFALNPVSMNNAGQLAIRVALADGRQAIVRADPMPRS